MAPWSSESGHWYDQLGNQIQFVDGSKKLPDGSRQQVAPTLWHARKLQLARGITSILGLLNKPQLVAWQRRQSILAALTLPRNAGETESEWLARVEQDADEHSRLRAEAGTALHAEIGRHLTGEAEAKSPQALVAITSLASTFGDVQWASETACSHAYGYGTKADLVCRELNLVGDIKTKDRAADVLAYDDIYDDHLMQLAATREAMGMPTARCFILVPACAEPCSRILSAEPSKLDKAWRKFKALLRYCQEKDDYRPEWAREIP